MFVEFTHPDGSGTRVLVAKDCIAFVTESGCDDTYTISVTLKNGDTYELGNTYDAVKAELQGVTNGD